MKTATARHPAHAHSAALDHHRVETITGGATPDPHDARTPRTWLADRGLRRGRPRRRRRRRPDRTSRASRNDPAATSVAHGRLPHDGDGDGRSARRHHHQSHRLAYDGAAQVRPTVGDVTLARHYSASATSADTRTATTARAVTWTRTRESSSRPRRSPRPPDPPAESPRPTPRGRPPSSCPGRVDAPTRTIDANVNTTQLNYDALGPDPYLHPGRRDPSGSHLLSPRPSPPTRWRCSPPAAPTCPAVTASGRAPADPDRGTRTPHDPSPR